MRKIKGDYYVLAVDPGLATGVCFFHWDTNKEPELLHSWELTPETFAPIIRWALANHDNVIVVCERFIITVETAKNTQAPFSLEHIGMLKLCMMDAGLSVDSLVLQTPGDAKKAWKNPDLKKVGYWHAGGAGHALDSIRHALLFMTSKGWVAKKLLE